MADNILTAKDIVSIMKACERSAVRKFELGSLKIEFGGSAVSPTSNTNKKRHSIHSEIDETAKSKQLEFEEQDDALELLKEFESMQLALLNPSAFEEQQLEGVGNENN
jgi:hypothetical protein